MKGLVYKDLIAIKTSIMPMIFLMAIFIVTGIISGTGAMSFTIMAAVLNMMIPLTCAGYDEQCGWNVFGTALPVSRTKMVLARYMTGMTILLSNLLIILVVDIIMFAAYGQPTALSHYGIIATLSLFTNALMNPVIYKFGVHIGSIIIAVMYSVPACLFALLTISAPEGPFEVLQLIADGAEQIPFAPILAILAVFYALSILLSISIYKKKDF